MGKIPSISELAQQAGASASEAAPALGSQVAAQVANQVAQPPAVEQLGAQLAGQAAPPAAPKLAQLAPPVASQVGAQVAAQVAARVAAPAAPAAAVEVASLAAPAAASLASVAAPAIAALGALGGGQRLAQVHYSFKATDGGAATWEVRRLNLEESLSAAYLATLELASEGAGASAEELEGASCELEIERGGEARRLCGIVCRVEALGRTGEYHLARVQVRPALALLGLTCDSRIFQHQTAVDIARLVLETGLSSYKRTVKPDLTRKYPIREYCTQYQESDLDFALRLLAEEGVFFYFDHSGKEEVLVLVDDNQRCPVRNARLKVVKQDALSVPTEEAILTLAFGRELQPTEAVVVGHDWTVPAVTVAHPPPASDPRKDLRGKVRRLYHLLTPHLVGDYDQGQKRYTREDTQSRHQLALEQVQVRSRFGTGESIVTGLAPGMVIEIAGHSAQGKDGKHLVTEVKHAGEAAEAVHFGQSATGGDGERYRNTFSCVPIDLPYRAPPRLRSVRPGSQTAMVVGPPREEIFTDEHGRIKVQFHWDHEGQRDDHSSCWIRVAQLSNFTFLPRVGMEVLVQFLDGDADRPLVVGCVFNGERTPPYELPARKTVSTIRTATSPANGGANELRFEDAAGQEELYLHAERDMNQIVKRNHSVSVTGSRSLSVGGDESAAVTGNGSRSVDGTETVTVKKTRTTTVKGAETQTFEDKRDVTVNADETLTVKGAQTLTVTKQATETYDGGRAATVKGAESLTVNGGNKDDTVHGEYNITADAHFKVQQGGDSLLLENAATLQSVGDVKVTNGATIVQGTTAGVLQLGAATELVLACGAASISLKADGTITIMGATKVNVASAGASLALEPMGATLSGPKISSVAAGIQEIVGALVKIN